MSTQTTERQSLYETIEVLSDNAVEKLASYAAFLRYEDRIPNAETLSAMEEVARGEGEAITLEEFKTQIEALPYRGKEAVNA